MEKSEFCKKNYSKNEMSTTRANMAVRRHNVSTKFSVHGIIKRFICDRVVCK